MTCALSFSLYSRIGQPTVVYYFGLTFLKVELSCAVQAIVGRQLVPPAATRPKDELKWKEFLASVDDDLKLYSMLCVAVKKSEKRECATI